MNHQKIYDNLIKKRLRKPAVGYTEKHHILPRSLGGSDDPSNLVVLTGREHWIAHLLLYKIHKNQSMAHACHMMAMMCEERGIPQVRNSRMYEHIRKECAEYTSKRMKKHQKGKGNSQYGTQWICNIVLKENKKINKNEEILEGWVKGRNKWKEYKKRVRPKKSRDIQVWKENLSKSMKGKNKGHTRNNGENNPMSKKNREKK